MLIPGAETEKVDFSNEKQTNNTINFNAWKKFIICKGYKPRQVISEEERKKMTEVEWREEIRLGKWGNNVEQREKGNVKYNVSWEFSEQRIEFLELWQKTPTYDQKKNTDDFNAWKEFIALKGYKPRNTILNKKEMSETEWQKEIRLGKWGQAVKQSEKNRVYATSWEFPEQRTEFLELWRRTPTYDQKKNTDNFNAWKEFIALKGYKPRSTIPEKERKKMTDAEWREEIRLGKWGTERSRNRSTAHWESAEQEIEFKELWQKIPNYEQKIGGGVPRTKLGIDTNNHTGQKQAEPRENNPHKIKVKESNISAALRLLGRGRFRKQKLNLSNPDGLNTEDITKKNEYDYVDNEESEAKLLENLVAVAASKLNKYLNKKTDLNKPKQNKPHKQYVKDETEERGFSNKLRSIQSAEKDLQELLNILMPEDKDILKKAYREAVDEIVHTNQNTTEWPKVLELFILLQYIKITYDKNTHATYGLVFEKYYEEIYKIILPVSSKQSLEEMLLKNNIFINLLAIKSGKYSNKISDEEFTEKYHSEYAKPEESFAKAARTILISMAKLSPETNKLMQLIVQEAEELAEVNTTKN